MNGATASPGESGASALLAAAGLGMEFAGGVRALEAIDVAVPRGGFVSIVGPSGCGKSTLLRLAAGLLNPTSGGITLGDQEPRDARREAVRLAFVFQQPALLPWRTVEGNVRLPLELTDEDKADADSAIADLLDLVGLNEFSRAYPHQLSGGMKMRVSLARALATRPDLLLLDEPFGALDEITRQRLNEELLALWERDRWTALFVTHNVAEAVYLSERVLIMSARPGRIVGDFEVDLPHPREAALRGSAEFAALCGRIGERLRSGEQ